MSRLLKLKTSNFHFGHSFKKRERMKIIILHQSQKFGARSFFEVYRLYIDLTIQTYLTYRMLARPNRPTREWHQVPGVTSTKIIRIQIFFLGFCLKYLTFLLGLCQFSERSELIWQNPTKR